MDIFEIKYALEHITIFVDTREQDTERARKRLKLMNYPYERKKLDFGDYSAKCALPDGRELDFSTLFAVERKMDLGEMAYCFGHERQRFEREFLRAAEHNARLYLLVENGSWESVFNGKYRSKMTPQSLSASMLAYMARYDCKLMFCKAETTPRLISGIVYREIKERLERDENG